MKTSEKIRRLNKTIKELKAGKIRELAELKIVCLLAEKQNEEIKRLGRENERERGGMNCLRRMAQTGLFEK